MSGEVRPSRRFAAVIGLVLGLALTTFPSTAAAASGITGSVFDGTASKTVAGQKVTLAFFQDQTQLPPVTVVADAKGAFSYPAPPDGATSLQASTVYRGAQYRGDVIPMEAGKAVDLTLKVFEPTRDAAKVSTTNWLVWIDPGPSGVAVQNDVEWANSGSTAYIGTGPLDRRSVTQIPVANGATDMQFLGIYLDGAGRVEGDVFVGTQPLVPGPSSATIRYTVSSLTHLSIPVTLPTDSLHLFVPAGFQVSAPGLIRGGQVTDRGTNYQVFTGSGLAAGDKIEVSLSGRPASSAPSTTPFIAAGVAILVVVAVAVAFVLRRRRRRTPAADASPPRAVPARAGGSGTPRDGDEAREGGGDDVDLVIEEIAALDIAFEQGLLGKETYERIRAGAKERLGRLRR